MRVYNAFHDMCVAGVHAISLTLHSVAEANATLKTDFLKEIATVKKITQSNCPYFVNMVGYCMQEPLALVLEYIPNGDLLTYLRTMRKLVSVYQDDHALFAYIAQANQRVRLGFDMHSKMQVKNRGS